MIVRIEGKYLSSVDESFKDFFIKYGKFLDQEGYQNQESKDRGEPPPRRYDIEYVGHIEQVPLQILNSGKLEISFYKGLAAMVESAVSHDISVTQQRNLGAINVHLPSLDLFQVNDVIWMEDACTQQLQKQLDDGFRIVACIPRPGQRRPDYVLGRINKEGN